MDKDQELGVETVENQENSADQDVETPEAADSKQSEPEVGEAPIVDDFADNSPDPGSKGDVSLGDLEVAGMDLLMDVHMEMTVELGRARLSIGDIMELSQGSVVELDKMAGEPVDLKVNGVLLAQGEVIVMDDVFGVRITRLNQRIDRNLLGR